MITIPLATVIGTVLKISGFFAVRRLYKGLRHAPMVYAQPVMFGFIAGLIYQWKLKNRRCVSMTLEDHPALQRLDFNSNQLLRALLLACPFLPHMCKSTLEKLASTKADSRFTHLHGLPQSTAV